MTIDTRLVAKGRSEPKEGLIQQGRTHVALAKQYAAALIESGWSEDDTSTLEREITLLEGTAAPAAGGSPSGEAPDDEAPAIVEAKAFIRRLRNALPRALREANATDVHPEIFDAGGKLGREASRISAYLERIRPAVVKLEPVLRKHFGGERVSALLDRVKALLDGASKGSTEATPPKETLELYAAKGRVLEMIEDLNRAGRTAFEGQAETVGKFNKDILLRARRERAMKRGDTPAAGGAQAG